MRRWTEWKRSGLGMPIEAVLRIDGFEFARRGRVGATRWQLSASASVAVRCFRSVPTQEDDALFEVATGRLARRLRAAVKPLRACFRVASVSFRLA